MDDSELAKIRERKKAQLLKAMEAKKKEEIERKGLEERKKQLIQQLLMPDALVYLNNIRQNNQPLASKIEDTVLVMYVNHLISPEERLGRIDIKALERRYTGQDSKIMVKRRGEDIKSLSEEIRD